MRSLARPPPAINILSSHSGGSPSAEHLNAFSEALTPDPSPAKLYISHKSTYGQRYLPSPPGPLSRTAGEGLNGDVVCDRQTQPPKHALRQAQGTLRQFQLAQALKQSHRQFKLNPSKDSVSPRLAW